MRWNLGRVSMSTVVMIGVAACAYDSGRADPGAAKTGVESAQLTLTIGDSQPIGMPTNVAAQTFADEVERLSGGEIVVRVIPAASDRDATYDESVIADLESGTFDFATIPTRAWVEVGVDSMTALQAPFEIVSQAHMAAVARDDSLIDAMFEPLVAAGLHGLVVFPEALRMMFSFGDPILSPHDLIGATVWSITPAMGDMLEPLGVSVVRPTDDEVAVMLAAGDIDVGETDFLRASASDTYFGSTATGDVPLTAKFISLVANAALWNRLDDAQRTIVDQAAALVRERAIDTMKPQSSRAGDFCAKEGSVVRAGSDSLAAFRSAVEPFVATLESGMLEAIRALSPPSVLDKPESCNGRIPTPDERDETGGDLPDGIYRFEWTQDFAETWNGGHSAAEAILFSDADVADLPATLTWTLSGGAYTFEIAFRNRDLFVVAGGSYVVDGDTVRISYPPDVGAGSNEVRWTLNDDGSLTMDQIDDRLLDPYFAAQWIRIGGAPGSTP